MVSLGIISVSFTTCFGILAAAAAAAAEATSAGTASQQHVQPQASDEKAILYTLGGMIGNTALGVSPTTLSALQTDAAAAATPPPPFSLSSDRIITSMNSRIAVCRQNQPMNDITSTPSNHDDSNARSTYQHPMVPSSHHRNNHASKLLLYMIHDSDICQFESPANKCTLLAPQVRGVSGPSTAMTRLGRRLISCFTQDECVCFDTREKISMTFHITVISKNQKMPRRPIRMSLLSDCYAPAHAAEEPADFSRDDRLVLDLANAPRLVWRGESLASSLSRESMVHAPITVLRPTKTLHLHTLVRRAPDNSTTTSTARATTMTVTTKPTETEEIQTTRSLPDTPIATNNPGSSVPSAAAAATTLAAGSTNTTGGLNGGTVAGIVVGVLAFLVIVACLLLWKRHQRRSKLHYFQKQHQRSARFSLSTTPPTSRPVSLVHDLSLGPPDFLPVARTASLPAPHRISAIPSSSDSQQSPTIPSESLQHVNRLSHLHQDFSTSYSSVRMPESRYDSRIARQSLKEAIRQQDETIQRSEPLWLRPSPPPPSSSLVGNAPGGASTSALRRLTLNISSALRLPQNNNHNLGQDPMTMAQSTPTSLLKRYTISGMVSDRRRDSGMLFGGSNPGPSRHRSTYDNFKSSRLSMSSARSVSSVQWVGFNDQMDYKEQHWDPTVQLAVTNQLNRQSVSSSRATSVMASAPLESSSRQNTPSSYRLSVQEAHSWEDVVYPQRSSLNLARHHHQHPSATSLPVLPYARHHTPTSLDSVLMDHSKISV